MEISEEQLNGCEINLKQITTNESCTAFDSNLKKGLKHFAFYPQMLPYFGNFWEQQTSKVLLIGESHYLPQSSDNKSNSQTWYKEEISLTEPDKVWTNTRDVIIAADRYALDNIFNKGHTIFYNLKAAIFESLQIPKENRNQELFKYIGYYNYFQRPAEKYGMSIINSYDDDHIAYETLKTIVLNAQPTAIIFVSKKAFNSFGLLRVQQKDQVFENMDIHHVPHPASPWWNRKSKHGTGKEQFLNLLKDMNMQIKFS